MAITTTHYRNKNSSIPLRVARGHFATNHSHINCYVDMTYTKHRLAEARQAAVELAAAFKTSTIVDTILCLDGTEVIGACMADELSKAGIRNVNEHGTIYVITPELAAGNQMVFRENIAHLVAGRHVLVLAASVTTGVTAQDAVNVIKYYLGTPVGICCIFSCVDECAGFPVTSIFKSSEIFEYESNSPSNCPLCKAGARLDAIVNSYGISSF